MLIFIILISHSHLSSQALKRAATHYNRLLSSNSERTTNRPHSIIGSPQVATRSPQISSPKVISGATLFTKQNTNLVNVLRYNQKMWSSSASSPQSQHTQYSSSRVEKSKKTAESQNSGALDVSGEAQKECSSISLSANKDPIVKECLSEGSMVPLQKVDKLTTSSEKDLSANLKPDDAKTLPEMQALSPLQCITDNISTEMLASETIVEEDDENQPPATSLELHVRRDSIDKKAFAMARGRRRSSICVLRKVKRDNSRVSMSQVRSRLRASLDLIK